MLRYFRDRPLLAIAASVAIILGVLLLGVFGVAVAATIRNSTASGFYGMMAETHRNRPQLEPFKTNEPGNPSIQLFGVSEAEGMALIDACSRGRWTLIGLQGYSRVECPAYELAHCDINDKSLIARRIVWLNSKGVKFTACKAGLCPDFAVDVATEDPPASCKTSYKFDAKLRGTKP
jgi:hypothetical protein